jgi:hypothetical protein
MRSRGSGAESGGILSQFTPLFLVAFNDCPQVQGNIMGPMHIGEDFELAQRVRATINNVGSLRPVS